MILLIEFSSFVNYFFVVALVVFSSQIVASDAILILRHQIPSSSFIFFFYESQLKTKLGKCSFQMARYANYFLAGLLIKAIFAFIKKRSKFKNKIKSMTHYNCYAEIVFFAAFQTWDLTFQMQNRRREERNMSHLSLSTRCHL